MAVLAAILPVVSKSSRLTLELYQAATESPVAATDFVKVGSGINGFASILKQVGTIIKEDDRLPSHEAIEILEDVIEQSQVVLSQIRGIASAQDDVPSSRRDSARFAQDDYSRPDSAWRIRLDYLAAHLEVLRLTLAVLLQSLYTAQSIMWSRLRPTVSPQQATTAVKNERIQLEALIIEQQMSTLVASRIYEQRSRDDARLLMESDSSQSLVAAQKEETPNPAKLYPHQDRYIAGLDISASTESEWLRAVHTIASSRCEHVLERWTTLLQFNDRLREAEQELRKQKQETQQPSVESDSEDDTGQQSTLKGNGARMAPHAPGVVQPLFAETNNLPIPAPENKYRPTAPLSPAASPRTSRNNLEAPATEQYSPVSPRSSITSLPVEAAAAMEAKEEDDDVDLEIPWTLCTRKYYWKFIDNKLINSNTDQMPSLAHVERSSYTEIMASWVCKEAIKEAGYKVTQVQKDTKDGRRTKLETCFCIEQPLRFDQVKHLVERTVEIYRKTVAPTPPPDPRRSSFQRPPPLNTPQANGVDRNRTPIARNTHPPLERSTSSMAYSPVMPPPLDRSRSMPGPAMGLPLQQPTGMNGFAPNPQMQAPPGQYIPQAPLQPQMLPQMQPQIQPQPRLPPHPIQTGPYSTQAANVNSPQFMYPPNTLLHNSTYFQPQVNSAMAQSPLRQTYLHPSSNSKYDDLSTTDSESGERERSRRRRSKSRSRYSSSAKKKSSGTSKAVGALMGVGGLTALLDGLSGL